MREIAIQEQMKRMGQDRTEWEMRLTEQDGFWTSHWNTIHEGQTEAVDIVPNDHEQYFQLFPNRHFFLYKNICTVGMILWYKVEEYLSSKGSWLESKIQIYKNGCKSCKISQNLHEPLLANQIGCPSEKMAQGPSTIYWGSSDWRKKKFVKNVL